MVEKLDHDSYITTPFFPYPAFVQHDQDLSQSSLLRDLYCSDFNHYLHLKTLFHNLQKTLPFLQSCRTCGNATSVVTITWLSWLQSVWTASIKSVASAPLPALSNILLFLFHTLACKHKPLFLELWKTSDTYGILTPSPSKVAWRIEDGIKKHLYQILNFKKTTATTISAASALAQRHIPLHMVLCSTPLGRRTKLKYIYRVSNTYIDHNS